MCRIVKRRQLGLAWMLKSTAILAGVAVFISGAFGSAQAAQTDVDTCKGFETEKVSLDKAGIAADLARGAEWGKGNLAPERLRQVKRFIFLEEQLTFRCPEVLAAAAVRQMEEQAKLKALAAVERDRLWKERMEKVVPPERNPQVRVARVVSIAEGGVPPLPERNRW